MMKKLFFISRHVPTIEQVELARAHGYEIEHVGDLDAFGDDDKVLDIADRANKSFGAVSIVHPALALRFSKLLWNARIIIFENGNRAPEGEKPQFYAKGLHFY